MFGLDTILGGLTGIIGSAITAITNYKMQKLKNEHDLAMVKAESEAMKEEARMQIEVTKTQIQGAVELADAQAYKDSQTAGNQQMFSEKWIDKLFSVQGKFGRFFAIPAAVIISVLFGFVDFLRGFMRPALTIYLTGITSVLTYWAWNIMKQHGVDVSADQAISTYNQVSSMVLYLTVSCVTWWFGDRRMAKFLTHMDTKNNNVNIGM